jgi:hypothetical protein
VRSINIKKKDGKKVTSSERISFEEFTAQQIISNNKKLKANEG